MSLRAQLADDVIADALLRVIDAVGDVADSMGHPLCDKCHVGQIIDRASEHADYELMRAWNAYCASLVTPPEPAP